MSHFYGSRPLLRGCIDDVQCTDDNKKTTNTVKYILMSLSITLERLAESYISLDLFAKK